MAKEISTIITIKAEQDQIWKTLTDFKNYPEWNPFILKAQGNLKKGKKLSIELEGMKFSPTVIEFVPEQKLTWLGNLIIPHLFDGEHSFELKQLDNQYTEFIHKEKFTGILPFFLGQKFFKTIEIGFEKMNEALKVRCEN